MRVPGDQEFDRRSAGLPGYGWQCLRNFKITQYFTNTELCSRADVDSVS